VDQFEAAAFFAQFTQVFVHFIACIIGFVFLPVEEVFFFGLDAWNVLADSVA